MCHFNRWIMHLQHWKPDQALCAIWCTVQWIRIPVSGGDLIYFSFPECSGQVDTITISMESEGMEGPPVLDLAWSGCFSLSIPNGEICWLIPYLRRSFHQAEYWRNFSRQGLSTERKIHFADLTDMQVTSVFCHWGEIIWLGTSQ